MDLRLGRAWMTLWVGLTLLAAPAAAQGEPAAAAKTPSAPVALVQDYEPRPALWLIEDQDTRIYLLGTIHILPPGFRWRSAAIEKVIAEADELIVESTTGPGEEEAVMESAAAFLFNESPRPILLRVPEEKRPALAKAIAAGPLAIEDYSHMKTWAAALMIGLADLLGDYGVGDIGDAPGVEEHLEAAFRAADKPIGQIEDPLAVLASLNTLPEETQRELLLSGLDDLAEDVPVAAADHDWAQGKLDAIAADLAELPAPMFDLLVRRRNAAWTEWLAKRLERPGVALIAVGAGHLAGPASVQTMLEARGLQVKRFD